MKLSLVIFGIFVGLVGILSYWSASEWKIFEFVSIPNPFDFLLPLNPYSIYVMIAGVILFLAGLFKGD